MTKKIIRPPLKESLIIDVAHDPKKYLLSEWLVTNGLGGYASGTVIGASTRKYHGLLIAALSPPHGRYHMMNHVTEEVIINERLYQLNSEEKIDGCIDLNALSFLKEFYLEDGLPVWHFQVEDCLIEKRIFMTFRQNTVFVTYELLDGPEQVALRLYPEMNFRPHEAPVNTPLEKEYIITVIGNRYEFGKQDFTPVRVFVYGDEAGAFTIQKKEIHNIYFRKEMHRGYEHTGDLWNPGVFDLNLKKRKPLTLVASTEAWKNIDALPPPNAHKAEVLRRRLLLYLAEAQEEKTQELVLAADQFIIAPEHRLEDSVRANAAGEEIRTIIAGYHWFTDWGRDTMISLEGLTLCTKRYQEARWILKTFAHYVVGGLIPNMFPEGQNVGRYNTADATLWFFHAIERFIEKTKDPLILEELLPTLHEIIQFHVQGTSFGIGMDPADKLMKQGAENYQLTWMDAKVGDWVVTPRRGKAVEINALWYNALKLMEEWVDDEKKAYYSELAEQVKNSFNTRFWIANKEYLFDVIDGEKGDDPAFRPNQLFAISLKYPVLEQNRWKAVVAQVKEKLLTPFGLRTLEIGHPDFKRTYEGDLRARDAAYHQGTVWPWLIGPFVDAWLKVYPKNKREAVGFLEGLFEHLSDAGIGTVSEIFDATEPYHPKGCMAQAWSIAEMLRTWIKVANSKD
jgi:predicted glycogen debranching enzyme